ncbi:hypothetical protein [Mitsuaria sp. 7]|uniref:hypothetical protein n=1 Tax=Mitsuaria sp. 7 TaxID=1658665 RepID=UPI0007DE2F4F|nr:hypothetical protein [Mitsuaria sp. 7]ANH66498.1 hypothetical protein ABE85_01055 [Mitsuaria sp. 7]
MSNTRPAPLLDIAPHARKPPFAWAAHRPVLAALALIAGIVLLAVWTGQDPYADREDCLARQGTPVVVNAALHQTECRVVGEDADDGIKR